MKLYDRLWVYQKSEHAKAIQDGYQAALDGLWDAAYDAEDQCFIFRATWGLEYWEKYLGLKDGAALTTERRRERIIARLLGAGVTTVEVVKNVINTFYPPGCVVTEHYADYYFSIRFLGMRGRPDATDQILEALEEIKPAHLGIEIVFFCRTYGELRPYTNRFLSNYTHDELRYKDLEEIKQRTNLELRPYTHAYLSQYTHREINVKEEI